VSTQDPLEIDSNEAPHQQSQRNTTAADLILHYLQQIEVEYVFGIPGGGIEPLYNALARSRRRGGPRAVIARHETGAAFMADGYARETGKLGVCCATTGPGATNMITGIASAYMDHTPLLAITAQTSLRTFGRGAAQESSCTGVNTVAMYQHCTRYNTLVSHPDQLEVKLISALTAALHPPFGPAHLSIPIDILRESLQPDPGVNLRALLAPSNSVDGEAVNRLHRILYSSRNIVFVLGAGARHAAGTVLELAVLLDAQVITTPHGKGLVSSFHPQYRGVYGLSGHTTAHGILTSKYVDAVVVIGSDLDEEATNGWSQSALLSDKMVFVDSSTHYFSRSAMARFHISGNIADLFGRLLTRFQNMHTRAGEGTAWSRSSGAPFHEIPIIPFERRVGSRRVDGSAKNFQGVSYLHSIERRQGLDRRSLRAPPSVARRFALKDEDKFLSEATPIKPQRLMYDLSRLFPPNTRFLADIGNSFLWAIHYLHPINRRVIGNRPLNTDMIRLPMGFSPMGWAIGAAVGTALAARGSPVVCITGDGALLMSGQELSTAVQENLSLIFVVLNDAALGTVKHGQQMAGAELIGFELPPIDFVAYSKAMGAEAFSITSPREMADLNVAYLCTRSGPTVLDVHIDPDELPPLEERIKMLKADMTN